ncbi:hypothetical protein U9M48_004522 [Paspalum notatum var. saurae]|uniref:NB-ARC domain-containing protein n=1 Tax=Paspalum notatum var. saurae TaxID=547442 RepID=A0AAQ3PTG4_PASNO
MWCPRNKDYVKLLTTRDEKVAEAVESRDNIFKLSFLPETESWSLFLKGSGWAEQDLSSDYIQVGKEIIKRCGGVPLAIKTLGAVLHDKKQISTWRAIRDNNLWNVGSINDRVFASLKLSYIHLADELKQCFTFCSIFPKGYIIQKDRLIGQWIAHGFISAMNGEQLEDIGSDYFDSLVKVSFLQYRYGISDTDQEYIMHDLIHDLTRQILHDELVTCLPINTTANNHRYRYLSWTSCTEKIDKGSFDKIRALYISDCKPSFDTTVKNSCCMRSVVLDYYQTDAPSWLFVLKFEYLEYLEVHNVSCTEVPEAISRCWNMQSLHFVSCKGFATLPESVGKLRKLRNLELRWITDLESLPRSIGDCQDLQSSSLRQLSSSNITGEFRNLRTINFDACTCFEDLPSTFSCHTLCTLNLSRTKVTMLPQWVTSIGTLECINLKSCTELVELPKAIANLKRLAVLNITGCSKLRCLPSWLGQLTRLRELGLFVVGCGADDARISELENLDMISDSLVITNLKYLRNPCDAEKACLKRKNNIEHLVLDWSLSDNEEELVSDMEQDWGSSSGWELLQHLSKLEELTFSSCSDLTQLPESMRSLTSLWRLHIIGCLSLGTLPDWLAELHSLRYLELRMDNWKQLPEVTQHLSALEELDISGRVLMVLPEWIGQLSALRELAIQHCPALQFLPQSIQRLTALQKLQINGCPCLARRCKQGVGADWHLVSHIPSVGII